MRHPNRLELCESGIVESMAADTGELTITVIKPGFNSSKQRYYHPDVLRRDFKIFDGVKMFRDHATEAEEKSRPEGSISNWVGSLKPGSLWVEQDGTVKAKAVIIDEDLKAKVSNLSKSNLLGEMGISIRARGDGKQTTVEGVKTNLIERLTFGRSVDFVTYPGAGGRVELLESSSENTEEDETMEKELKEMQEQIDKLQTQFTTKEAEMKRLLDAKEAELTEAKAKIAESEKNAKIATAKTEIAALLTESKLPQPAKDRLAKRFDGAEASTGVKEAIADEIEYIGKIAPAAGRKIGMAESKPKGDTGESTVDLVKGFQELGMSEAAAKIAAAGR